MIPIIDFSMIKKLPETPILIRECEGECCGRIKENKVTKDTFLYQYPDSSSKKIGTLTKNSVFNKDKSEFFTRIDKYGSAIINGKAITIIHSGSEGMPLYFDGKSLKYTDDCVACLDEGKIDQPDGTNKYKYKPAQTQEWIKLYYKNNFAWINEANFEMSGCN